LSIKIIQNKLTLKNSINKKIFGDLRYPSGQNELPVVVFLHGFKAFKDWGFFPLLAERIAKAGAITITFNFSLNGVVPGIDYMSLPEDFERNTISQECEDASIIFESIISRKIITKCKLDSVWNKEIYVIGFSRGGGIALISAKKFPEIKKVVLCSTLAKFDRYSERQKEAWRKSGYIELKDNISKQPLKMLYSFMQDVESNRDKFDLYEIISELDCPTLIIHGEQDMTVPMQEVKQLALSGKPDKVTLELIQKTGHTFGLEHPFGRPNEALETAITMIVSFFGLK
jgi:uncharacterized protein